MATATRVQPPVQRTLGEYLPINSVYEGDARSLLERVRPDSIALSVWSPPYFVGKSYEKDLTFEKWKDLIGTVVSRHYPILKPGGFLVVNIVDILAFSDPRMPRFQANCTNAKKVALTRDDILRVKTERPDFNRYQLADLLGCSEQTIQRRIEGVQVRGGKQKAQTRVQLIGGLVEEWAASSGLYLYDRRIWTKDPAWANDKWHSMSYRSVDEYEYLFVMWKPGETRYERSRLRPDEWAEWGSRAVWSFPSVRANDVHEAMFPPELPRRCIRLFTDPGDTVLDCFAGSGTTLVEAIRLGRNYIGIDIMPRYAALAKRACAAAFRQSAQSKLPV